MLKFLKVLCCSVALATCSAVAVQAATVVTAFEKTFSQTVDPTDGAVVFGPPPIGTVQFDPTLGMLTSVETTAKVEFTLTARYGVPDDLFIHSDYFQTAPPALLNVEAGLFLGAIQPLPTLPVIDSVADVGLLPSTTFSSSTTTFRSGDSVITDSITFNLQNTNILTSAGPQKVFPFFADGDIVTILFVNGLTLDTSVLALRGFCTRPDPFICQEFMVPLTDITLTARVYDRLQAHTHRLLSPPSRITAARRCLLSLLGFFGWRRKQKTAA